MRRAIDMLDWERAFVNTNVNGKVFILNKIILNILPNFRKTPYNKDPLWFAKKKKKSHLREKQCL